MKLNQYKPKGYDKMLEPQKDIFKNIEDEPREHYRFMLDPDKLLPIEKKYVSGLIKRLLIAIVAELIIFVEGIFCDRFLIGFAVGLLLVTVPISVKNIRMYKKSFEKSRENYLETVFDYSLYSNYMIIWITAPNSIKQIKADLTKIKKSQIIADFIVMEIDGQLYVLEKNMLIPNSFFIGRSR